MTGKLNHTPIAQEMTAQLQLGLFGTVGKLARQLRSLDRIAPRLKEGGLVRRLEIDRDRQRTAIGISVAQRRIEAFGGLLYGAAALGHGMTTKGGDIAHTGQLSRMDVGDMSLLEAKKRLQWKSYGLVYDLLEELFEGGELPELLILDIPLVMGRSLYAQLLVGDETDHELQAELDALKDRANRFWDRWAGRCYPFDLEGPKVVSLARGRFGSLLRLIHKKDAAITPDPLDPEVAGLISGEWAQILSVGIDRVLHGILAPEHRTAAFDREQDRLDKDAFPTALRDRGSVAFHYLTGLRGQPVQVETLGSVGEWADGPGAAALDSLAGDLVALTYFDHRQSVPLPLWYARQGLEPVKKKGLLEFYKREALRAMRQEQVDRSWLVGWEDG